MGIFAIILSLVLLIYFAYRGVSVLLLAPVLSMLAIALANLGADAGIEVPVLTTLSSTFMPAVADYVMKFFPVFLAGAIFGKLMGASGAAQSIAHFISSKLGKEKAILATVIATALLTYGGVSLFVVVFAMYPIGASLFREAGIPKRLLPGAIALGAFTFTMTAMPGSPQSINALPIGYFGTTTFAAPILGILGSAIMLFGGLYYLGRESKKLQAAGEGYGEHPEENLRTDSNFPPVWAAFLPLVLVFAINTFYTFIWFKRDAVIERYADFGGINGTWSVIIGLAVASIVAFVLYFKHLTNPNKIIFDGAVGSLLPIFNTASEVGYGGVIKSLAAFSTISAAIGGLKIAGLFKVAIITTLLAGVVGSSSGGTALALGAFAQDFLSYDIDPQVLHRVMLMAAGGLDTFPHSGAVVTLLAVVHITPKQGYKYIAVNTMLIPLIATFVVIVVHLLTGLI
jgi:H+/gluconate symporter-like permease